MTVISLLVAPWGALAVAQSPQDSPSIPASQPSQVSRPKLKKLPPDGIEIKSEVAAALTTRIDQLRLDLATAVASSEDGTAWEADVEVLIRAVDLALKQDLFFKKNQINDAEELLQEAARRIIAGLNGDRGLTLMGFDPSANQLPQPLVGGFVSRIDDSVQPFGIVVPAGWAGGLSDEPQRGEPQRGEPNRLDVWLHGRGDTKTEIPFLTERLNKPGQYTPNDTFVLHPFGRHCNAFKFAGETDVFEAIEHAATLLNVDRNRVSIRGFSMGGAGCWHLAVHHPSHWFAANPGAGFVDTLVYQGWVKSTPFEITPTAEKLLHWYDVLPWVENLSATRTIAYSGEVDKQKQAADRVVERAKQLGLSFPYVIGEKMGHKINSVSADTIERQLAEWADQVSDQPATKIDFVTYTLRYPQSRWIRVTGMDEHWTAARVKASLDTANELVTVDTEGVSHLEIDFSDTGWPGRRGNVDVQIDGTTYSLNDSGNRRGFQCTLARDKSGTWTVRIGDDQEVRKRPGMQGPIDDAFCDRFVIVIPSRPARHGQVQRWIDRETAYLKSRWSRLMRGEVQVVIDRDLTEDQIETCNLICFGDYSSNRFLFKISNALPIEWTRESLLVGKQSFDPVKHVPVFCYPNPLNPDRYLVVNSGMTFREFSNTSNSRQIAMLPDWAVLDVTSEDDSIYAGGIVQQGFFDESWKLQATDSAGR